MTLGVLQYLREKYPEHHIVYAVPKWILPLFSKVEIACDEVIGFDLKGLSGWKDFWRQLTKYDIETIFECFQRGSTEKFFIVYSFLKRIPYYFHNHHVKYGTEVLDQGVYKSNIQRDLDGAYSLLINDGDIPNYLEYEPKINIEAARDGSIILGVVATRQTKMWPLEHYAKLIKKLKSDGHKIIIPLAKSRIDQEIKANLSKLIDEESVEFLETSLENLPVELSKSSFYIGNDTGLKHICVSLGLKTITLFGPEPPMEWHPYNEENHKFLYRDGLECRTREAHFCGLSECESMICLNQITVNHVINTFQTLDT